MKTMKLSVGLAFVAGILFIAGCSGGPSNQPTTPSSSAGVTITGAGATFPYPLYSRWIGDYQSQNPNIRINYQSIGSGGGIQQLKNGTVDFGASDAPLSDEEMKAMPAPVMHIPTVAGAVAVVYNLPGITQRLKLTGDVLADIYLGQVKSWNDPKITALNSGVSLPNVPISVSHRADGSGTTYIFTNYLKDVSPMWASKVGAGKSVSWPVGIGGKGNEGVAGIVKQRPGSIGYVELAYADQIKLAYASIRNAAGEFIDPSVQSTTAAAAGTAGEMAKDVRVSIANSPGKGAYPIAGFTYILLYQTQEDATKGKALVDFLDWAIHSGQSAASSLMYAPLPAEVVRINENALKTIKTQ